MCTAINITGERHLFGRTLDLECSYGEQVVVTPENFKLDLLHSDPLVSHSALIGTAHVCDGYPLYYDAANRAGLAAAALNFPERAVYHAPREGVYNLASFELIPWVLSKCTTISEVKRLLRHVNVTKESFREELPSTPLHWIFADKSGSLVVEPLAEGLRVNDDPFGVLTNAPEFEYHLTRLSEFASLSPFPQKNTFCPSVAISEYSRGMGCIGLPGDFSSSSRFVRAVFVKAHTRTTEGENTHISRFFHVIGTLNQPNGCAVTSEGLPIRTVYSSCIDTSTSTYYFTTYDCRRIRAVRLNDDLARGSTLLKIPMDSSEDILFLN